MTTYQLQFRMIESYLIRQVERSYLLVSLTFFIFFVDIYTLYIFYKLFDFQQIILMYVQLLYERLFKFFKIIEFFDLSFFIFIYLFQMNWLRANRVSANEPLGTISRDDSSIINPQDSQVKSSKNNSLIADKIKSNPSFSLQKISSKVNQNQNAPLTNIIKRKDIFKLPSLKKNSLSDFNPQDQQNLDQSKEIFYQSMIYTALQSFDTTYMKSLARQHFYQTVEALRITRNIRLAGPKKQIKLEKKSPHKKTIYLDMDQTLIHTDQLSNRYTVKLSFPIETGGTIQAGVRIRPMCKQFLTELAKIAEIIIFTASSASYANVILDYLDPNKNIFAYRLYRNHCTLEKGYYIKDLRVVNRKMEDVAIVDNSAYSFLLQPENGIPILPFYHFAKDRQLLSLLSYLKQLVQFDDLRASIRKTFFLQQFIKQSHSDPKKLFLKNYKKQFENKSMTFQ